MRSDGTARCNPIGAPRHQLRGCCQRKWSPASGDHGHSSEGAVIPASLPRRTLYRSSRVFRTAEQGRRRQSSLLSPACAAGRMSLLFQYRRMEPAWHGWTIAIVPCRKALAAELVQCPFPMRTAASVSCADRERPACPVDPKRVPRRRQCNLRRYDESRPVPKPGCVADRRNRPLPRHVEDVPGSPAEPARPMAAGPATVALDGEARPYGPESAPHRSGFGPFP